MIGADLAPDQNAPANSLTEVGAGEKHQTTSQEKSITTTSAHQEQDPPPKQIPAWRRALNIVLWTPPRCRWDPEQPPKFSMFLNFLFAFAGCFTVANLYYNHPILNILAEDFQVPYVKVAQIPTLAQAGYATGLLFLCPLGDMLKRRPFIISLVGVTATLSIGLCVTKSIEVFSAIQYLVAITTCTPQLLTPLVGDLAPPNRRATALSIVTSGMMLGILLARLLAGIITQYTSWRNVYWFSVAAQYTIFLLLWLFMPDYPSTNPGGMNFFAMLWSIVLMLTRHPVLVQACIISLMISATFTNYWTTLTFLLAGPPYFYDPVTIGLFALIGIASMCIGPFYARYVTDRFVPLFTVLTGVGYCLVGIVIGTYTGTFTVAGPILQAFFNDFGMQISQIANRSAIFTVEPKGRSRMNTAFMVFTFSGQLLGTSVGARLYERGGWIASGSFSVGCMGVALLTTLARGPWEDGWVGWHGGWSIKKKSHLSADGRADEAESHLQQRQSVAEQNGDGMDVEKGMLESRDHHQHRHGHDNQAAVNATDAEKSLDLSAAEDVTDRLDDDGKSEETKDEIHTIAPEK